MNYAKYQVVTCGSSVELEEAMNSLGRNGWKAMSAPAYMGPPIYDEHGVWIVWMEYQEDVGRLADRLQPTASGRYGG